MCRRIPAHRRAQGRTAQRIAYIGDDLVPRYSGRPHGWLRAKVIPMATDLAQGRAPFQPIAMTASPDRFRVGRGLPWSLTQSHCRRSSGHYNAGGAALCPTEWARPARSINSFSHTLRLSPAVSPEPSVARQSYAPTSVRERPATPCLSGALTSPHTGSLRVSCFELLKSVGLVGPEPAVPCSCDSI